MSTDGDPVSVAAWYVDAGYPQEALNALRDADTTDPRVAFLRGRALLDSGRHAEADAEARRGLALSPEDIVLLELLASVQLFDNANAAELTLRQAMKLSPENPRLLGLYVFVLMRQGRFEWAEKMLERLMRVAPDDEATHRVRTSFMLRATQSSAVEAAREFLREYPDDAYAHYLQGLAELGRRWWRGLRHLREAARLRPQDPLIVETARLMHAWYVQPLHWTSGAVHWVIATALLGWMMLHLVRDDLHFVAMLAPTFLYSGLRWAAVAVLGIVLEKRVSAAMRRMYG